MAKGTLALRQIKLGDNADTSKNFVISVPAVADGTLVIERGNGTDVLKFLANGGVEMPTLAFLKNQNGYVTLPNGIVIQWGISAFVSRSTLGITFPTPFSTQFLSASIMFADLTANGMTSQMTSFSLAAMQHYISGPAGSGNLYWFAIGH